MSDNKQKLHPILVYSVITVIMVLIALLILVGAYNYEIEIDTETWGYIIGGLFGIIVLIRYELREKEREEREKRADALVKKQLEEYQDR